MDFAMSDYLSVKNIAWKLLVVHSHFSKDNASRISIICLLPLLDRQLILKPFMLDLLQCLDERKSDILESNKEISLFVVQYSLLHANMAKCAERLPLNSQHNYLQLIQTVHEQNWSEHFMLLLGLQRSDSWLDWLQASNKWVFWSHQVCDRFLFQRKVVRRRSWDRLPDTHPWFSL